MALDIECAEAASQADREAILRGLVAFNDAAFGPSEIRPLVLLLREAGDTVGGLWGRTSYGFLYVELLFVPERARGAGLGRDLLERAEASARGRGASGAWIDCFGDANRSFYERAGYEVFGSISGMPPGGERFFLKKAL
jgi:GNAT superfamily N-acetyltransferase